MTEKELTLELMRVVHRHFEDGSEDALDVAMKALANAVASVISLRTVGEAEIKLFRDVLDRHEGLIKRWKEANGG